MNYEWFQDDHQIKLRFEVKNTTLHNIKVEVADVVVKVNILDKKFAKTIDLFASVLEGAVVYGNNILEVTLIKVDAGKWTQLTPDLPKDELIKRRQAAFLRREQEERAKVKNKEDLKLEFDKHTTKEQMRIEDAQRKKLDNIKTTQKDQAINDLYGNMDGSAQFQSQKTQQQFDIDIDAKIELHEKLELEKEKIVSNTKSQDNENNMSISKNQIFTEKEIQRDIKQPLPEPRKQAAIQLQFTERVYPNLAVRETQFKDAPLPRTHKLTQKEIMERENPLFLKDKGDEFFRNKDFYSAINAYSAAFKFDSQLIIAVANRSACYLHQFNYDECIDDCQFIIQFYANKQKDTIFNKVMQRLSICKVWKGELENVMEDIPEEAQERIKIRLESLKIKALGDMHYNNGQFEKSVDSYLKSLQIETQNELTLSNLGLAYMKLKQFEKAIDVIDLALIKVKPFLMNVNLNPNIGKQSSRQAHDFLLKNYMRKATCLYSLNRDEEALFSVKQSLKIDETNDEARTIMNKIQLKIEKGEALKLKEKATEQLKAKEYENALVNYNECLKRFNVQDDLMDFLAVLLNKCVCCYFSNQFDEIIGCCSRGITLIQKQSNKILSFEKISREERVKLNEFQVRFLVRRSNAYLKQFQNYHAKCDLEEALKIDPNNQQIKADLQKLLEI